MDGKRIRCLQIVSLHVPNYYRFWDTARYLWKNRHFIIPPCIRHPRQGGSRRNISTPFGTEKLEWCRYPMVKKFRRYLYSFWRDPRTCQTDRRTLHDSKDRAYAYASLGNNYKLSTRTIVNKGQCRKQIWYSLSHFHRHFLGLSFPAAHFPVLLIWSHVFHYFIFTFQRPQRPDRRTYFIEILTHAYS